MSEIEDELITVVETLAQGSQLEFELILEIIYFSMDHDRSWLKIIHLLNRMESYLQASGETIEGLYDKILPS